MNKLSVIYGCMSSGKTSKLLEKILECNVDEIIVIKHSFDNRYDSGSQITTHNGKSYPAVSVKNMSDINIEANVKYIFIDEAQFFTDLLEFVKKYRNTKNITISGLNLTYDYKNFGQMSEIIELAEESIELVGVCSVCGGAAKYTTRDNNQLSETEKNSTIIIGGMDLYRSVCANDYPPLWNHHDSRA
jgi:thymidine kinase